MRQLTGLALIFTVLLAAYSALAEAVLEPTYSSEKPLYAFVVVNEAGTKVLKLVFDESQGTGKGYDTIYADLNFNEDLTDDAVIEGTIRGERGYVQGSFPSIEVPVPYNEKAEGIETPCWLRISYTGYEFEEGIDHRFSFDARIRLRGEEAVWEYSWPKTFQPVAKGAGAVATSVVGEPSLLLNVSPDEENEGHVRVSGHLMVDRMPAGSIKKDDQAVRPQIAIRNEQGEVIHVLELSSSGLGLGPSGIVEYSAPILSGARSLEARIDTGPLAGVITAVRPFAPAPPILNEPVYASEKPLYAAIAVNEAASKVLTLVFDESKGTGKGYDTLYADLNFNGDLTDDEAIEGTLIGGEGYFSGSFSSIAVSVPYNDKGQGIEEPCELTVQYFQFSPQTIRSYNEEGERILVESGEQTQHHFMVSATIRLRDEAAQWECFFFSPLSPAEKPEQVLAVALGEQPSLQLSLVPSDAAEGNVGIGATVMAGKGSLSCTEDGQPLMAHLEVTNERGVTIHSLYVDAEKLVPG